MSFIQPSAINKMTRGVTIEELHKENDSIEAENNDIMESRLFFSLLLPIQLQIIFSESN